MKPFVRYQYMLLQMCFWMLYCVGYSYVTLYLRGQNYSSGDIGIITAIFGGLAAVLQPLIGKIADGGGRKGWKPLLLTMLAIIQVVLVLLLLLGNQLLQGILFGIFLSLLSCMMPLVNAANFYYENQGIPMKFGVARGLGSLFYAFVSFIIGQLTLGGKIHFVPVTGIIIATAFILVTISFPYDWKKSELDSQAATNDNLGGKDSLNAKDTLNAKEAMNTKGHTSGESLLKKYPGFFLVLLGFVFLLMFHNIANTYLLQMFERVGGDSSNFGTALSISAILELPVMFGFSRLNKKFSMRVLLSTSGIAFAIKSIFYLFAGSVLLMYITQIWQAFSFALFIPASVYFAEKTMEQKDLVKGQALVTTSITLGAVLGNLIGGFWLEAFGIYSMMVMSSAIALAGAIIVVIFSKSKSN